MRIAGKVFLLMSVFILLFPSSALATRVDWDVVGGDSSALGQSAFGTRGSNYVMNNPTIVNQHVSSMYVIRADRREGVEVGWFANTTQSNKKPRFFFAWMIDGIYYESIRHYPTPGTNHNYQIGYNGRWNFFIDGTKGLRRSVGTFTNGKTLAASERDDTGDTNYSHFWDMQKKNPSYWYDWSSRYPYKDNDPYYYIHWPGSSQDHLYMQLP